MLNSGAIFAFIVCYSAHYLMFPHDPAYAFFLVESLFSKRSYLQRTILYILYGLFNACFVIKMASGLYFLQCVPALIFFTFARLLSKELSFKRNVNHKTSTNLREIHNLSRIYRQLQVLHKPFIKTFTQLTVVCHVMILQLTVCTQLYLFTKREKITNLVQGIMLLALIFANGAWLFILDILCKMFMESRNILRTWTNYANVARNSQMTNRIIKKFQKSCKPLMFVYGGFYRVKRNSVIGYLKMIVRTSIKSLITLEGNGF